MFVKKIEKRTKKVLWIIESIWLQNFHYIIWFVSLWDYDVKIWNHFEIWALKNSMYINEWLTLLCLTHTKKNQRDMHIVHNNLRIWTTVEKLVQMNLFYHGTTLFKVYFAQIIQSAKLWKKIKGKHHILRFVP